MGAVEERSSQRGEKKRKEEKEEERMEEERRGEESPRARIAYVLGLHYEVKACRNYHTYWLA